MTYPNDRRVYLGADGPYLESSPGAGPRHHDDTPLTPADVEARDRGTDPTADVEAFVAGNGLTKGDMDAMEAQRREHAQTGPYGRAYAVVGSFGLATIYEPEDRTRAEQHAQSMHGYVVALPVIADHRRGG